MISVLIPIYNTKNYLEECLNSVVYQTFQNLEIILIDDGSTDGSSDICDRYAEKDSRIKVFHRENCGIAATRNFALKQATGEYIVFCDSDDFYHKQAIEMLYKAEEKTGADIVIGDSRSFGDYTEIKELIEDNISKYEGEERPISEETFWELYSSHALSECFSATKLYKKEVFADIVYPEGEINEDADVLWKLVAKRSICYFNKILYFYRRRENSIMHTKFGPKNLFLPKTLLHEIRYIINSNFSASTKIKVIKYEFDIVEDLLAKAFSRFNRTDSVYKEAVSIYDMYKNVAKYLRKNSNNIKMKIKMTIYMDSRWVYFGLRKARMKKVEK